MITTYAELQTDIADWLNRSDLAAVIPTFIQLVDARLNRDQLTRETKELTLDDGTGTLALNLFTPQPSIPLQRAMTNMRSLMITGVQDPDDAQLFNPPLRAPVIQLTSVEQLYARRSELPTAAITRFAAVQAANILLAPLPDNVYRFTIIAEVQEPLSDANPVNDVLLAAPDVYLYGALVEAAPYIKDDERMPLWDQRFQTALGELERARSLREWPNTPVATQPRVFS